MGSSSKKHKRDKEIKKKKHKSRSRSRSPISPLEYREKERKHHKKHKERRRERDRSPDVEEVPVDSHLKRYSPSPPTPPSNNGNSESLSIQETNRLRAKLGLKPLEVTEAPPADDGKITDDLGEFYHKPAVNLAEQKKSEKIKERLEQRREKRKLEQKFTSGHGLGDDSGDEDATAWVEKSRKLQKQKEEAARKARELEELDAQFGVSELVEEESRQERNEAYTARNLLGLRVAHDTNHIAEERDIILTLADKQVLDDDNEDVLVNVNLIDDDRYRRNIELKKQSKSGYIPYDDDLNPSTSKAVLSKYDDEIDTKKRQREAGFVLGDEDAIEAKRFKEQMIKQRLFGGKRLETLELPSLKIANDYMNEQEIEAKFKKSKRKGKIRKKPKAEPIDVDDYDPSNATLDTDDTELKPDRFKNEFLLNDDEIEPDSELQEALSRARRIKQESQAKLPAVHEILNSVKEEEPELSNDPLLTLDSTAEFCRTLGEVPTYEPEMEVEVPVEMDMKPQTEESGYGGAWSRVDVSEEQAGSSGAGNSATHSAAAALASEPELGAGLGGALQLALSKGYLEKETGGPAARLSARALELTALHYSIEDKTYDDDKYSRRERGHDRYSGPIQEFKEKETFKPDVKLEYIDDDGRPLCPKEAFRYLSHKFHGKGPGKNKQEKRIKKNIKEGLMKKMSSTDTPLGTLAMLQEKQKELQTPYITLSKSKRDPI